MAADQLSTTRHPPSTRARLTAGLVVGVLSALFSGSLAARPGALPDLLYPLEAARLFLDQANPYLEMTGAPGGPPLFDEPLFYPFTTVLALLPIARLAVPAACGLFVGLSAGVLAYLITRDGLWRLHLFASAPFVIAATLAQFSPLLMVMALVPAAGFLAALKPNLGFALFAYRPSRRAVVSSALFAGISVLIFPSWPLHWLDSIRHDVSVRHHQIPLLQTGGIVLLLALLSWRQPAARLLLAMSCVPQALFFYDQLLLWLIPRTRNESLVLTAASQLAMLLWFLLREPGTLVVASAYPFVIALVYLPALGLVLRHWRNRVEVNETKPATVDAPTTRA